MKRYIRTSDWEYTSFISDELPKAVEIYLETDNADYRTTKAAVDAFFNELDRFPSSHSIDSLSVEYDEDKRRFYKKYHQFASNCRSRMKTISPSGYGRGDYEQVRIKDLLCKVDYNFPYGWKHI